MMRRFVSPIKKAVIQSRKMAHAANEPPKTGIDAIVAKYLPKNHHVRKFKFIIN